MMSLYSFFSAIELGLIYSLMVLGLFISYRILNIPDLTVDGSFTLGAAVAVVATLAGHPVLGLLLAALAGAAAGFVTALLQTRMKIQPILAGIITMTALYSINLMVMDNKANLPLAQGESIYHNLPGMLLSGLAAIGVAAVLVLFLQTPAGLAVRATGDNEAMVRSSSINADRMKMAGLSIANACVALSGALIAHYNCYAEVRMGIGMVVIGLASLIVGEIAVGLLVRRANILSGAVAAIVGSVLYRLIIAQALEWNFSSSSLKLITAIIVALAMSVPAVSGRSRTRSPVRRKGQRPAARA